MATAARNAGRPVGEFLHVEDEIEAVGLQLAATVCLRAEERREFRSRSVYLARLIAFAVADVFAGNPPLEDYDEDEEGRYDSAPTHDPRFHEQITPPRASPLLNPSQDVPAANTGEKEARPDAPRSTILPLQHVPVVK